MSARNVVGAVRALGLGFALLGLAACGPSDSDQTAQSSAQSSYETASLKQTLMAAAPAPGRIAAQQADAPAAVQKRIAVSHSYTLRLPSRDVERVQQAHIDECAKLGCDVLNTRLDRSDEGRINAWTSLRIAPDKLAEFTQAMTAAPVQVISHAQTADDKTLPLLDVEKRLEAKIALRDRLDALLKDNVRKTAADLIAIEKEIAQVQGDIEAATSQRDYLLTITDTVRVDITYMGVTAQAGGLDLSPIARAVNGAGRTVIASVASLISFAAAALPWIPVALLVAWIARVAFRRWRRRPARA
jgi:hypothetical protein